MLRYLLLGLLAERPRYGYDLKKLFEQFLGGTWPLNVGQVYTTLAKLEADGWIRCERVEQELLPDRKVYSLTEEGDAQLDRWVNDPVDGPIRLRDEFFLKVLLRSRLDDGDPRLLIARQRRNHLNALAELVQLRDDPELDATTALLLDGAALRAEADLRWLELCEDRFKELRS